MKSKEILFIVGMPRSGTKLLRDLLNRHAEVSVFPNESHVIPFFSERFERYGDVLIFSNFEKFYNDFINTTFYKRVSKKDFQVDLDDWFRRLSDNTFKEALYVFFQIYKEKTDSQIVGDKTPSYISHVPLLVDLFPNAKFIHIYRDPRDYVLSMENAWNKNKYRSAQRWKIQINKFITDSKLVSKDNLFEVSYENLIDHPRDVMNKLCKFLKVNFSENMLNLNSPSENLGSAKGLLNIKSGNHSNWKNLLTEKEKIYIEKITLSALKHYGYTSRENIEEIDINKIKLFFYKIQDAFNLIKFHIRDSGGFITGLKRVYEFVKHSALRGKKI